MTGNGNTEGIRVELFSRSGLPSVAARRRDAVAERLTELAEEGRVSTVEVDEWDKKVPVDADTEERDRYEEFRTWADEVGVSLEPFFERRECYSMSTGSKGERLVLPALCLAVYLDDRLQTVYPHSTPQGTSSVTDCLDAIETVRTDPRDFEPDDETEDRVLLEAAD